MTWVPEACSLPSAEQPLRVAEFDGLFASALRGSVRRGSTWLRLLLVGDTEVGARIRDLVARESQCCSFFTFDVSRSGAGWDVDVRVPESHVAVLDSIEQRAAAAAVHGPVAIRKHELDTM